jgi:hypothetical protein
MSRALVAGKPLSFEVLAKEKLALIQCDGQSKAWYDTGLMSRRARLSSQSEELFE